MYDNKDNIEKLIRITLLKCESWIKQGHDGMDYFIDPNDGIEISAHYGATHTAAAFILWGKQTGDNSVFEKGVSLLQSILNRWDKSKTLPAFHYDFNNLALSMVENLVVDELSKQIRETVLSTNDSNHDTINWLPMRWAVNKARKQWTTSSQYDGTIDRCKKVIADATNADGGIEDRLPFGMSFNLQYDLATVAVMQYLRCEGEKKELSKELGFLLNCVTPDGDINYLGRGTNQIFAWGLWIYLLSSSGQVDACRLALDYLSLHLPSMLKNNNLMLNKWEGNEKYLWWDYHYASVYTAHFLLWLVLAYRDIDKCVILPQYPTSAETGVHIYRTENAFVSWFEGRKEYLAEKGPVIAALWTKRYGIISKGTFGPWQGAFGNNNIFEDIIFKNFFGLLEVNRNMDWSKNRYIHKIIPSLESAPKLTIKPIFSSITVNEKDGKLEITFYCEKKTEYILNIPTFSSDCKLLAYINGNPKSICMVESIRNQYDWVWINQTRSDYFSSIEIVI